MFDDRCPSLGELVDHFGADALQVGVPVDNRTPRHPQPAGQLVTQVRLIDHPCGLGVGMDPGRIEGAPDPGAATGRACCPSPRACSPTPYDGSANGHAPTSTPITRPSSPDHLEDPCYQASSRRRFLAPKCQEPSRATGYRAVGMALPGSRRSGTTATPEVTAPRIRTRRSNLPVVAGWEQGHGVVAAGHHCQAVALDR